MEKNRNHSNARTMSKPYLKAKYSQHGQMSKGSSKTRLGDRDKYVSLMTMKSSASGFLEECNRIMFKDRSVEDIVVGNPNISR